MSLIDMGHEVVGIVVTGEQAIEAVGSAMPDLVLMDIVLAGEIDGIEAAGTIKRRFDIPVVFVTAYTDEATAGRIRDMNPAGVLQKPVDEHLWQETLNRVFGDD